MATQTATKAPKAPMTPPAGRNGAALTGAAFPDAIIPYDREYDPAYLSVAYPPNEEPMADPIRLRNYLKDVQWPLDELFSAHPRTLMLSNVFLYHRLVRDDPDSVIVVAPDLMIARDVDVERLSPAKSYHTWFAGKSPEFAMEFGSDSTANRDIEEKPAIYAAIGVKEYWLTDPPDGDRYKFLLKGLRLVNGRYQEIPMIRGEGDDIRGYSEVLKLYICWENGRFRLFNPATGEYLRNHEETVASRIAAEFERDAAEAALAEAQAEIRRLRAQLANRSDS